MADTITVFHDQRMPDGSSLQVIEIADVCCYRYFVRLKDSYETLDSEFSDYPQAYAHWRNTCRKLGFNTPYVAPEFSHSVQNHAHAVERGANEIFYDMHSQLSKFKIGSDEATGVIAAYMRDPLFIENANEICALAEDLKGQIGAVIRVACKRSARAHNKIAEEQLSKQELFGMF